MRPEAEYSKGLGSPASEAVLAQTASGYHHALRPF